MSANKTNRKVCRGNYALSQISRHIQTFTSVMFMTFECLPRHPVLEVYAVDIYSVHLTLMFVCHDLLWTDDARHGLVLHGCGHISL